tara:strand:- start:47 stop:454 length:408 start_codon:yes stop_codon:yes gene_type:complete
MDNRTLDNNTLAGIVALLIHTAKIDEKYTDVEEKLILDFLKLFLKDTALISKILIDAKKLEESSNHLLNFTKIIKEHPLEIKSVIIKGLWKIVLSDKNIDSYEANLIRKICGLIYFSDKLSGEIKLQVIEEFKKT